MSERALWILGAGGHAKVVISALLAVSRSDFALFDDAPPQFGTSLLGIDVASPIPRQASWDSARALGHIAIGSNAARARLAQRIEASWETVVHPSAVVAPDVTCGHGSFLATHAVVHPGARIGSHCIVNTAAIVEHDCVVGDFCHVAPGAILTGGVRLGKRVLVGAGAVVRPNVSIGDDAICGAGAVVVADVPAGTTVVGVPARILQAGRAGPL